AARVRRPPLGTGVLRAVYGPGPARVGWVEAIAETHHNPRRRMMGFALLYPSYSGNGGKRMEECSLPVDR
ncbi:MAG TPA: hypothetical protein VHH93_01010, partial [Gammaproteobacteria bacterium]|nr:hypothetical protein [Gammaproteobacteria bacterium]